MFGPSSQNGPTSDAAGDAGVFRAILTIRLLNAFLVNTFFQPDEFFQSLEPAWKLAFGPDSGAWITWVLLYLTLISYTYFVFTYTIYRSGITN